MMAGQEYSIKTLEFFFLFFISNIKKIKPRGLNWSSRGPERDAWARMRHRFRTCGACGAEAGGRRVRWQQRPASSGNILVLVRTGSRQTGPMQIARAICMDILLQEPLLPNQGVIRPQEYINMYTHI
jgi:hypothetical protein